MKHSNSLKFSVVALLSLLIAIPTDALTFKMPEMPKIPRFTTRVRKLVRNGLEEAAAIYIQQQQQQQQQRQQQDARRVYNLIHTNRHTQLIAQQNMMRTHVSKTSSPSITLHSPFRGVIVTERGKQDLILERGTHYLHTYQTLGTLNINPREIITTTTIPDISPQGLTQ